MTRDGGRGRSADEIRTTDDGFQVLDGTKDHETKFVDPLLGHFGVVFNKFLNVLAFSESEIKDIVATVVVSGGLHLGDE